MTFFKANLYWIIPLIVTIIIAIITPLISIQKKQQKIQNNISLLGKRTEIFNEFKNFISNSTSANKVDLAIVRSFLMSTSDSEVLFDVNIEELKSKLIKLVSDLHVVQCQMEAPSNKGYENQKALIDREFAIISEISSYIQDGKLNFAFSKYLDIQDNKFSQKSINNINKKKKRQLKKGKKQ